MKEEKSVRQELLFKELKSFFTKLDTHISQTNMIKHNMWVWYLLTSTDKKENGAFSYVHPLVMRSVSVKNTHSKAKGTYDWLLVAGVPGVSNLIKLLTLSCSVLWYSELLHNGYKIEVLFPSYHKISQPF